jgi:hypothetical protein
MQQLQGIYVVQLQGQTAAAADLCGCKCCGAAGAGAAAASWTLLQADNTQTIRKAIPDLMLCSSSCTCCVLQLLVLVLPPQAGFPAS